MLKVDRKTDLFGNWNKNRPFEGGCLDLLVARSDKRLALKSRAFDLGSQFKVALSLVRRTRAPLFHYGPVWHSWQNLAIWLFSGMIQKMVQKVTPDTGES
jgi:hypothetical protein